MDYIVKTPCGEVRGVSTDVDGVIAFKGIRYATAERFKYPVEVTEWDGIYDATEYGACAYQPRSFYNEEDMPKKIFYYNEFRRGEKYTYDEDCLFLNIFTTENAEEKKPVIVYIHGGGFRGGSSNEKHFDVPVWPQKGVVGVTLNYRLGPLGFIALPELKEESGYTGNYGLYDQLTAISWVKNNIAAFGGDPDNITIMGQSAGAMSVQQHCLSPLSKGMFHKAVMCSGGGISKVLLAPTPEKMYPFWTALKEKLGCKNLDELRAVPVEEIFSNWEELKKTQRGGHPTPCIDGRLIVDTADKILGRGEQHKIPYLIGSTSEDMLPPFLYSMASKWCEAQESDAYLWFFERSLPGDDHGAWHSADLWYWFGTLKNCWRPFEEKDYSLSNEMSDRLCTFAKTGSPNSDGLTEWVAGGKQALTLGDNDTKMAKASKLKLWYTMFTNEAPGE